MKRELVLPGGFASRDQARAAVFEYLEVLYNRTRMHSTLGYTSPAQFEAQRRA